MIEENLDERFTPKVIAHLERVINDALNGAGTKTIDELWMDLAEVKRKLMAHQASETDRC